MSGRKYSVFLKRKDMISRNELGQVINHVKIKTRETDDEFKRQAWAEVGLELNRIFLHLGIK